MRIAIGLILLSISSLTLGQGSVDTTLLRVGVYLQPPYVIKHVDGTFYGVSIDLWHHLAGELDLNYQFAEHNDQLGLLRALNYSEVDLAINPMTINGPRLKLFEAAHPFITSEIGVATSRSNHQFQLFLSSILSSLVSMDFLRLMVLLLGMILVFGLIMWIAEKRKNPNQFKGLVDGFWWSVCQTTFSEAALRVRQAVKN